MVCGKCLDNVIFPRPKELAHFVLNVMANGQLIGMETNKIIKEVLN